MDPLQHKAEDAQAVAPAREAEPKARQPITDTTSIHLTLLLKVLIPTLTLLAGGAFTLGKWFAGKEANDHVQQKLNETTDRVKQLTQGLGSLISSLDTSDQQAEELINTMKAAHADSEVSIFVNLRGLRIYQAESTHNAGQIALFRTPEIERALKWFKRAQELDASANFPYWNAACMYGLLHNTDETVRSLSELYKVTAPSRRSEFEQRLIHDPDLCPIDQDTRFQTYVRDQWKIQRAAHCSSGGSVPPHTVSPP